MHTATRARPRCSHERRRSSSCCWASVAGQPGRRGADFRIGFRLAARPGRDASSKMPQLKGIVRFAVLFSLWMRRLVGGWLDVPFASTMVEADQVRRGSAAGSFPAKVVVLLVGA